MQVRTHLNVSCKPATKLVLIESRNWLDYLNPYPSQGINYEALVGMPQKKVRI